MMCREQNESPGFSELVQPTRGEERHGVSEQAGSEQAGGSMGGSRHLEKPDLSNVMQGKNCQELKTGEVTLKSYGLMLTTRNP